MFSVLWRYRVAPAQADAFAALYGADGDWARLFRGSAAYLGTTLYRDAGDPGTWLTIDRWTSRAAYEAFLETRAGGYAALDARGDALTVGEERLGTLGD